MSDYTMLSERELVDQLHATQAALRTAQARQHAVVAELNNRGVLTAKGYRAATFLMDALNVSRSAANTIVKRTDRLHEQVGVSGNPIPATAPHAAAALEAGVIDVEHIDVITAALDHVSSATQRLGDDAVEISHDEFVSAEEAMVDLAQQTTPQEVRTLAKRIIDHLDPDGPEPPDNPAHAHPCRELELTRTGKGNYRFTGELDHETGHLFHALLSPLSKPRPASETGEPDLRSAAQRRGDAFADLLDLAQRAQDRPVEGAERPKLIVTIKLAELMVPGKTRLHGDKPVLADGTPITVAQARRIACDAGVIPAVLSSDGEILDLGRTQRLASPAQRRALELRDQGCVKCGRPPKWCHVHHITYWTNGGPTNLNNMCLLCPECHRLVHHANWQIKMQHGKPKATPPEWLQKPTLAKAGP